MESFNEYTDEFKDDMMKLVKYILLEKEPYKIDNEKSKMKEKYCLSDRLNDYGYKTLKQIMKQYWEGKRLDDQQLTLAYILLPKIVLYEDVPYRIYDMVAELEQECEKRWGSPTPTVKPNKALFKMTESNPNFIDDMGIVYLIDSIDMEKLEMFMEEKDKNGKMQEELRKQLES